MICSESFWTYFRYPANVLIPVLLGEAKVFVQPKPDVIAVQAVSGMAQMEEMLFQRSRYRRFP